jgi:hypothetical protein
MAKAYVETASLEPTGCDLPGVVEDGMSGRTGSESVEPLEGRLGAVCTAKASGTVELPNKFALLMGLDAAHRGAPS